MRWGDGEPVFQGSRDPYGAPPAGAPSWFSIFMRFEALEKGGEGIVCETEFGSVSAQGESNETRVLNANVTRETIACFLQIHVYHGRGGLGIVLAGAGDGSKGEIVEKVGAEMVSRDIVGWGLNLGLQQAPAGQCRLLAGALPGKCSIDVGELVALLKFMQEAINTFGNRPSEEQIGVLVYTIYLSGCTNESRSSFSMAEKL